MHVSSDQIGMQDSLKTHDTLRSSEKTITILAGKVFDPFTLSFATKQAIYVSPEDGLIISVKSCTEDDFKSIRASVGSDELVDLTSATVLPGFVDTHVHREFQFRDASESHVVGCSLCICSNCSRARS